MTRQVVLDTETTGLEPAQGHRIVEIGCVELIDRRFSGARFHQYLNPDRDSDEGALEVHGLTREWLADQPRFADVVDDFLAFTDGSELIIHNAPFDLGFLDHELALLDAGHGRVQDRATVLDSLLLAKRLYPGQRVSLDALCKRLGVDNSARELHGALLDAQLLAEVYLTMTGGQVGLSLEGEGSAAGVAEAEPVRRLAPGRAVLPVLKADSAELQRHQARLAEIAERSDSGCLWQ